MSFYLTSDRHVGLFFLLYGFVLFFVAVWLALWLPAFYYSQDIFGFFGFFTMACAGFVASKKLIWEGSAESYISLSSNEIIHRLSWVHGILESSTDFSEISDIQIEEKKIALFYKEQRVYQLFLKRHDGSTIILSAWNDRDDTQIRDKISALASRL